MLPVLEETGAGECGCTGASSQCSRGLRVLLDDGRRGLQPRHTHSTVAGGDTGTSVARAAPVLPPHVDPSSRFVFLMTLIFPSQVFLDLVIQFSFQILEVTITIHRDDFERVTCQSVVSDSECGPKEGRRSFVVETNSTRDWQSIQDFFP